jgi:hypothetical protein
VFRGLGFASASRGKSLGNVGSAEVSLRQQTVVDTAEQSQILTRPRLFVVDLKERAR